MQDILHGRCSRMEQKILLAQHRMVRNFLRWHCFSQRTAGETAKGYSITAGKRRSCLHTCIHKGENGEGGRAMWDASNHLIRFITDVDFSDPSYHLPHFYELFALWAKEEDRAFFKEAAEASRNYLKRACHPVTGLSAEYAEFDGTPYQPVLDQWGRQT